MEHRHTGTLGLLALAVGAFGIGVTEFAPMGLLPVIANDLGISIPTAGLLVSAYALGVVIGAPVMTLSTGRVPRRTLLIALAGIFTIGNLPEPQLAHCLAAFCPNILFPYAREAVSNLVSKGSFPQLNLAPVNFDALFAQHMAQVQAQQATAEA